REWAAKQPRRFLRLHLKRGPLCGPFATQGRSYKDRANSDCANHKKCLCTSGIGGLRERHAASLRRWSLRKCLFLLACSGEQE
ncbi:MAG: hypothetical protein ACN6PC_18900, partial [Pseudomonas putida]